MERNQEEYDGQELSRSLRRWINYMAFLYALNGQRDRAEALRRVTRRKRRFR